MGGITITDTHMSSPDTPHTATVTAGGWEVSWLPGRTLDRNQAITAMTIASTIGGNGVPRADDPICTVFSIADIGADPAPEGLICAAPVCPVVAG
jgi:hypothetical protein